MMQQDRLPSEAARCPRALFPATVLVALLLHGEIAFSAPPVSIANNDVASTGLLAARPDQYSQSDIARLKALARGQDNTGILAYPQLILNGRATHKALPIQQHSDNVSVDTKALAELGVQLPSTEPQWQTLDALGIAGRYQSNEQLIKLIVPASWLPAQLITADNTPKHGPLEYGEGALINYDIYSTRADDGSNTTTASHEARLFSNWGAISSSGLIGWNDIYPDDNGEYVRLDSFWRYTDPNVMRTYVLGDAISGSLSWTPALHMGGIHISRNFSTRPDLITFPLPQVKGSAVLPSALEVFVNDLRITNESIEPGPFTLETKPTLTGLGEVQVVTTDTLGRTVTQTLPFYVSPQLLREGLWDYSATVGTPRENYRLRSNDYDGQPVASGVARYGVNGSLTLESSGTASSEHFGTGIGAVMKTGLIGVSNIALSHGNNRSHSGQQWVLGHEYRTAKFSVSGQYTRRTRSYRDIANTLYPASGYLRDSLQLNSYYRLPHHHGSLNASYLTTKRYESERNEFLVLSHNRSIMRALSLNFSVNQNLRDSSDRTWLASVNYYWESPKRRPINVGARLEHHEEDGTNSLLTMRQNIEEYWDVGWNVAVSPENDGIRQAGVQWRTPYAELQGGTYGREGDTNFFASMSGAVVAGRNHLMASNRIHDSYAIIETGGFANIPVRQYNRLIGRTNKRGQLLLPNLTPYISNKLSIDVNDLPADTHVGASTLTVTPSELSGLNVEFDVEQRHSAVVLLTDAQGEPLPLGSRVLYGDTSVTVVGHGGEAFIDQLQSGRNQLTVIIGEQQCQAHFNAQPEAGTLQRIGPFPCLPSNNENNAEGGNTHAP